MNGKQEWVKVNKSLKVQYTEENIGKCMCPECPVLAGSECVSTKLKSPRDEMNSLEKGNILNSR